MDASEVTIDQLLEALEVITAAENLKKSRKFEGLTFF